MVEFTDEPVITRRGAPRVEIDPMVAQWCEDTYTTGKAVQAPLRQDDPDAPGFLRMLRIYGNRQHKTVDYQFVQINGESFLRFRMRDRKVYNRAPLPREASRES
jgi:hypothetical protein